MAKDKCPSCGQVIEERPVCWICRGKSAEFYRKRLEESKAAGETYFGFEESRIRNASIIGLEIKSSTAPTKYICENCKGQVRYQQNKLRREYQV